MSAEKKLEELGITLPTPVAPVASYVPTMRTGNLVIVSGQVPMKDGTLMATGKVGAGVTLEEGQNLARQCVINVLAALKAEVGSLDNVARVVRLGVFVASADEFTLQHKVANGASDLVQEVFGDAGKHARAAVGVNTLPLGAPVEVELMAEVRAE